MLDYGIKSSRLYEVFEYQKNRLVVVEEAESLSATTLNHLNW